MRALAVQKDNPVPLYYQLAELIRLRIASGEFQPGDRLASARTISEDAGISRMTVRQALEYLERQGHIVVRRGDGTFIAAPKLTYHAVNLLGFSQEMIEQGRLPSSRVLEQVAMMPPAQVAARLAMDADRLVVKVSRLRLSQEVPVLLETVYLPQDSCPGLEADVSPVRSRSTDCWSSATGCGRGAAGRRWRRQSPTSMRLASSGSLSARP